MSAKIRFEDLLEQAIEAEVVARTKSLRLQLEESDRHLYELRQGVAKALIGQPRSYNGSLSYMIWNLPERVLKLWQKADGQKSSIDESMSLTKGEHDVQTSSDS